jgi:hypothetical protein
MPKYRVSHFARRFVMSRFSAEKSHRCATRLLPTGDPSRVGGNDSYLPKGEKDED